MVKKLERQSKVTVRVKLTGILKGISKKESVTLNFEKPVALKEVIFRLAEMFSSEFKSALIDSELKSPRPNALILLNGKEVGVLPRRLESEVRDGDEIVIIPVTHGG
ncbi:MAG TPA: hypothetical protein ENF63_02280 [Candidatus Bathyarchaeota archaeon]|nr:hypothetical protein [Candidatus Bathyarchaeota archaeon]